MRRALFLTLLLASPLTAQQVQVSLSPHGPTVGDRIEAVVSLRVEAGALAGDPRFPVWRETWGEAEVVGKSEPRKVSEAGDTGGMAVYEQRLTLAAFRTGRVPLPPVQIAVPLRSRTVQAATPAGLSVDVRSVIPQTEKNPRPKGAKPPVSLPVGEAFWWTLAGMLAACLVVGLLLLRRRAAPEAEAVRPALAPFDELVAALDGLARETSSVRLHTALSLALRHYLGRTLAFAAEESTTSEIHRHLLAGRLPAHLVRQAVDLLRACDLVKFARPSRQETVGEDRSHERIDAARRIAHEVEERTRPQPLEAAG